MGVFNAVFPVVVMLLIGFLCKKFFIKNEDFWVSLNKMIYYIMFPALMIYEIGTSNFSSTDVRFIPILVSIVILFMFVLWLLKPLFNNQQLWVAFIQGSVRYNSYIFIGVTFYYVGREAMPVIGLITAFLIITTNVISVVLLNITSSKKKSLKTTALSTIKNPLIVSCLCGLIINKVAVYLPSVTHVLWVNNTLKNMGFASLALSLMGVGAQVRMNITPQEMLTPLMCSLIKLVLLPCAVIASLKYMHFARSLIEVCAIYAGSPCSSNATAMTQSMGGDYTSMSLIISMQTILSLFTLGVWLFLFHQGFL